MNYHIAQNPKNGTIDFVEKSKNVSSIFSNENFTIKESFDSTGNFSFEISNDSSSFSGKVLKNKMFVSLTGNIELIAKFMVELYKNLNVDYALHIYDSSYNSSDVISKNTTTSDIIELFT